MYRCIAAGVFCVFAMPDFHSVREGHHLAENSPMVRVLDKKTLDFASQCCCNPGSVQEVVKKELVG
jgi:hypothetical protein